MRITEKNLHRLCDTINRETGNPRSGYKVGQYIIDNVYGGYKLAQIVTEGGGERDVIEGLHTKAVLYELMQAYLSGLRDAQKTVEIV